MKKVLVIGSLNIDRVVSVESIPKVGQTVIGTDLKNYFGGKGANQAVTLARLESNVSMLGMIGDDKEGLQFKEVLEREGVKTDCILTKEGVETGFALIEIDKNADNAITVVPGANHYLTIEDIESNIDILKGSDIILLQLEIPLVVVEHVIKKAKEFNKYIILNPAPAAKISEDILKSVDIITPNETELEVLTGMEIKTEADIITSAKKLLRKGLKQIIVTLGEAGALYISNSLCHKFEAHRVNAIDPTGAGDCFNGALTFMLANDKSMNESIEFAMSAAALSVTKSGAINSLPSLTEVNNFIKH